MQIGEKLFFGDFEWRVLDVQDDSALIITEYIIEQRPYHDAYVKTTWADCALRRYLNGDFYQGFSLEEQSRIIPVLNENPDNPWYGTAGGADTQDAVFLLSLEEVCRYFGDSLSKLYNKGKNQRYWFERKDENNIKRMAWLLNHEGLVLVVVAAFPRQSGGESGVHIRHRREYRHARQQYFERKSQRRKMHRRCASCLMDNNRMTKNIEFLIKQNKKLGVCHNEQV